MKAQVRSHPNPSQERHRRKVPSRPKVETRRVVREERRRTARALLIGALKGGIGTALAILLFTLIGEAKQGLMRHEIFTVEEVQISGLRRLTEAEIRSALGIQEGGNIFEIDPVECQHLIEQIPRVRRAEVTRIFPNAVRIEIVEREEIALLLRGRLYGVDEEGVVVGPYDLAGPAPGPIISGISPSVLSFGQPVKETLFTSALSIVCMLRERRSGLLGLVSEVHMDPTGEATLVLQEGGVSIRLRDQGWEWKLECVEPILASEKGFGRDKAVAYVDFCGERAFVGYQTPSSGPASPRKVM